MGKSMGGGGKCKWGRLGEKEEECVAGRNQESFGARLGLRHLLCTQFSKSVGTACVPSQEPSW